MNYIIIFGFLALSIGQGMVYGGLPPDVVSVPSEAKLPGPKENQLNSNKENAQPNNTRKPGQIKNGQPLHKPGTNSMKPGANSVKPGANSVKPVTMTGPPNQNQQNVRPLQPSSQAGVQQNKSQQSQRISTANPNQQNRHSQQPRAAVSSQQSKGRVALSPQKTQAANSANTGSTRTLLSPAQKPVNSPAQNSPSKQAQQGSTSQRQTPEASNQQTQQKPFVPPPQEIQEVLKNVLNVANEIIYVEAGLKEKLYILKKVDEENISQLQKSLASSDPKEGITHDLLPTMVFNVLQKILLSDAFEDYVNFGKMDDNKFVTLINNTLRTFTHLFNIEKLPEIDRKHLPESASLVIQELGERISLDGFSVTDFLNDKEEELDKVLRRSEALKGPDGSNFNVGIIRTHFEKASDGAGPGLVAVQN